MGRRVPRARAGDRAGCDWRLRARALSPRIWRRRSRGRARVFRAPIDQLFGWRSRASDRLVTVRVPGIEWSDLGSPERLVASLHRTGGRPSWLSRVDPARATEEASVNALTTTERGAP